ncbi:hypothetical protein [Actinomadura rubrisoli]|uniref:Uncharacterized protein n=1 Tax=Actinomadura rubrisoli TaxID=2530368 RepID=A0A4R5BX20_9ACTN|nr:hypothetical protein [Actinomadura rubrisoli]TDD88862.1 hypothetical protein E1298_14770 [Actinomadura rubrisoli]
MAMTLPVRFRGEGARVAVETDAAHAPLRDFLLKDLGDDVAAIARARGRLGGDPSRPWQELYRYHRLDYDGTAVHVRDVGGWASCALHPAVLRRCLEEYERQVGDAVRRRTAPGGEVAATLALGSASPRTQGWGLIQTPRATLEDMAGLTPHPDACLPHGVMGTGSGACWADLAVLDGTGTRLRGGTKTFMPRGIDAARLVRELGDALTRARFLTSVPGAWTSVVAGVPVHGYVDPDAVLRLPCEPIEAAGVAQHVRVFFPELAASGVDLESAASSAGGRARAVEGARHVLTAFLLHDVQSHRHHLDVVRAARPGWEHTGNACHIRLDVRTARLEHLWLPGHACELPTGEFARALQEYERLLPL